MNRIISSSPLVLVLCLFVLGLAPQTAQSEWVNLSDGTFTDSDKIVKLHNRPQMLVTSNEGLTLKSTRKLMTAWGWPTLVGISMLVFVPENADVYDMVDPDEKTLGKLYQYPRCAYNAVRRTSDEDCLHVGEVAATASGGNPGAFDYMWF